jgi:hypothetical protein
MSALETYVGLEGAELDVGETAGPLVCPVCDGGRTGEAKFYVTRVEPGVLAYVCHRASCGTRGAIGEHAQPRGQRPQKAPKIREYTGEIHPLTAEDERYFRDVYGLLPTERERIKLTGRGEYLLPIYDPRGSVRGYVVRQPWSTCKHREANPNLPKAMSFLHKEEPLQSWYGPRRDRIVVVEDQLSAICAAATGMVRSVALLGTTLSMDKVREIQQERPSEVIIALDANATDTAFKLAREWGLAFPKTRVAMLERDLKDTPINDIPEVLGL